MLTNLKIQSGETFSNLFFNLPCFTYRKNYIIIIYYLRFSFAGLLSLDSFFSKWVNRFGIDGVNLMFIIKHLTYPDGNHENFLSFWLMILILSMTAFYYSFAQSLILNYCFAICVDTNYFQHYSFSNFCGQASTPFQFTNILKKRYFTHHKSRMSPDTVSSCLELSSYTCSAASTARNHFASPCKIPLKYESIDKIPLKYENIYL